MCLQGSSTRLSPTQKTVIIIKLKKVNTFMQICKGFNLEQVNYAGEVEKKNLHLK